MAVDLAEDERLLLISGVGQWGGPAAPTRRLAVALGFADVAELLAECSRLSKSLARKEALSSFDLARALVATEIVFASDAFGAGVEWETVTGISDEETIATLRRLQRKLVGHYGSLLTDA